MVGNCKWDRIRNDNGNRIRKEREKKNNENSTTEPPVVCLF